MTKSDLQVEWITFLDTETRDHWREYAEAINDMTLSDMTADAVGFVISETPERIVLTSMKNNSQYAGSIGIPKKSIIKRTKLDTKATKVV